jgi:uncharacterized protein (TIGR03435 family)
VAPGGFLPECGFIEAISGPNHTVILGARNVPLRSIAAYLGSLPPVAEFGRRVVDQTRLTGTFDFSLNWLQEREGPLDAGASQPADAEGPSFSEALRNQLGLKLKPTKAAIQTLIIDHVEQPSPN